MHNARTVDGPRAADVGQRHTAALQWAYESTTTTFPTGKQLVVIQSERAGASLSNGAQICMFSIPSRRGERKSAAVVQRQRPPARWTSLAQLLDSCLEQVHACPCERLHVAGALVECKGRLKGEPGHGRSGRGRSLRSIVVSSAHIVGLHSATPASMLPSLLGSRALCPFIPAMQHMLQPCQLCTSNYLLAVPLPDAT